MKKFCLCLAVLLSAALTVMAQNEPYKMISLEEVVKHGGHCDFNTETCEARFDGNSDRWFDVPGFQGDFSEHSNIEMEVLESNVILKFVIRYKNEEGKTKEVNCATLYGQMGKGISKKKTLKLDLSKDGEFAEQLKSMVALRVAMGKPANNAEEGDAWYCKFGTRVIVK